VQKHPKKTLFCTAHRLPFENKNFKKRGSTFPISNKKCKIKAPEYGKKTKKARKIGLQFESFIPF